MKNFLLFVLFSFLGLSANAQFLNTAGDIDHERWNFGFLLGVDKASFTVAKQKNYSIPGSNPYTSDTLQAIRPMGNMGFSLGLLANLKLDKNFDLRFTPKFSFVDRQLEYQYNKQSDNKILLKQIESTFLELPLLLKFKSDRQKDVRLYVIGGFKFVTDIRSKKKKADDAEFNPDDDRKLVKIDNSFMALEAGIGADIYLEYFKFSPEFKLSHSINNVMQKGDDNIVTRPLAGLFAEALHFTMYFE
ncbi:outer membrane beta-barrel protein [Solitalea lacus]|uniref:type IX secretion/gliding motility protein PorT/SprT n=1 Tax=Solitalea lacus TaxID=2911172 RepID=UPI001EDA56CF|nr:outer membrane beta-barrel protein [Solitalea lacus]UKJ08858.1 PorT family protein [Solitalea lacus]